MARWTDEHNEMMKEMIDKGRSLKSIAGELGFSLGTLKIRSARLKEGFINTRKEWTEEDTDRAVAMRKRGKLMKEIAEVLGAHESTVTSRLKPFKDLFEQDQFKPQKAGPRTYVNSVMKEPLKENSTPSRPGAMGYAKIRSRGL